jgi:hypothetical protein
VNAVVIALLSHRLIFPFLHQSSIEQVANMLARDLFTGQATIDDDRCHGHCETAQ